MAPCGWKESGTAMFRPWAKALWALLLGAGFGGAQQPAVFRSDVKLVLVIATVKNRAGVPVGTLGKDDFEIYDNGVKQEIARSFPITRIAMVHRLGRMLIGETSVAVMVTAPHRRAAFEAALEGINRLKRLVPIWK